MSVATFELTDVQVEFFRQEGYLSIPAITTPEEVAQLRVIYERLFAEKAGSADGRNIDLAGADKRGGPRLPQILRPSIYAPELRKTLFWANVQAIGRQIFGANYLEGDFNEHMIYKPPYEGAATPWHQDQAYHDPTMKYRNINVWMPLDDATEENGCMHYVPRSHELDVLPHHHIDNDPNVHGLEVDEAASWHAKGVACPIPAGGAVLHASYMLHYAGANKSPRPRRAYILVVKAKAMRREVPVNNYWMRQTTDGPKM
jgi:hypothetical protein